MLEAFPLAWCQYSEMVLALTFQVYRSIGLHRPLHVAVAAFLIHAPLKPQSKYLGIVKHMYFQRAHRCIYDIFVLMSSAFNLIFALYLW